MFKRTKPVAIFLLLIATGVAACGEKQVETEPEAVKSEVVSSSPDVTLGEQFDENTVAQTQAGGDKQLYIKTEDNIFVNADVYLPSSAKVHVIAEEYYGDTNALYKQIRVNTPIEGKWDPA